MHYQPKMPSSRPNIISPYSNGGMCMKKWARCLNLFTYLLQAYEIIISHVLEKKTFNIVQRPHICTSIQCLYFLHAERASGKTPNFTTLRPSVPTVADFWITDIDGPPVPYRYCPIDTRHFVLSSFFLCDGNGL